MTIPRFEPLLPHAKRRTLAISDLRFTRLGPTPNTDFRDGLRGHGHLAALSVVGWHVEQWPAQAPRARAESQIAFEAPGFNSDSQVARCGSLASIRPHTALSCV